MPSPRSASLSREFLENLIDAVREPLVVLDQDLRVVSVSRSFYEVFRVKPKETIGQRIYDLGNRQWDIPQLRELLENILPQKTWFDDYEVTHTFTAIGPRTMLLNARQIRRTLGRQKIILLAIEDVTHRKENETILEESRKELEVLRVSESRAREFAESIIDTIREPLVVLDQDFRIVAVSRAFETVFQTDGGKPVGQSIFDLDDHQWDIPPLRELLEAVLLQSTTFNDYEVVHEFPRIGRRTMLLNARQIKRSLGKEKIVLLVIEDITSRRLIEAELQTAQRVESLGLLAGGIAHDFNNLMAGLMINIELAAFHLRAGNPTAALARIDKTPAIFVRGRVLTRRLLTFSKGGAPVRSPVALGPLIAEWVEFALVGSDITCHIEVDPDLWPCDCDIGQIGQVVNNLLINARQASPPASEVSVQVTNLSDRGNYVALCVHNPGPPIPDAIISRIFDPFFTTKAEGSGLGLAICFSIVRQHGGWIDVSSEEGRGTSLTVVLPATPRCPLPLLRVPPPAFRGHGKAVVMEDDESIREAVGEMMRGLGFEVVLVRSGNEVLDHCEGVAVFLLDGLIVGGMGGIETAERLRTAGTLGQIILMSGHFDTEPGDAHRGSDGFWRLAKPFTIEELCLVLGTSHSN